MVFALLAGMFNGALNYTYFGNTVKSYIIALALFLLSILIIHIVKVKLVYYLGKVAKKTKSDFDDFLIDIIKDIGWPLYTVIALYVAAYSLSLPDSITKAIYYVLLIIGTYYVFRSVHHIVDFGTKIIIKSRKEKEKDASTVKLLGKIIKITIWVIAAMLILSNLGYDISTLIAGLGIGGIAIAFALQNVLTDLFASISIYFDKPFQEGDFIIIDNDMGTVEHIGMKSTRIKTLHGHQLVISNKELTTARVHNYKRMKQRRVAFAIGVTYQTSAKKLKKIPGIVEKVIKKVKHADFSRAHFKEMADFALIFEIVYFMDTTDYVAHMDAKQAINLGIMEEFAKEKIEFAYPTQTVFVEKGSN